MPTVTPENRTAISYTTERLDVTDAGLSLLLNPTMQYIFTHSGVDVSNAASSAVLDMRENNADPATVPSWSPASASQKAWRLSPGGPDAIVGPLTAMSSNVTLIADTGEEAMVLMTGLPIPPRY